jgi:hypothetical protein
MHAFQDPKKPAVGKRKNTPPSSYSLPLKIRSNSTFGLSWLSSQNITPPR